MDQIRILTCPECDRSALFGGDDPGDRKGLKAEAWAHLRDHRLSESERGIYGVMMVDRMERRDVEVDDIGADHLGEWLDRLPATVTA